MKIYLFSAKGDELLIETDVVEEAEQILRKYEAKKCGVVTPTGDEVVLPLMLPLPDVAYILWPMAGGK